MRKTKEPKAITLIALIITIVVLLILAVVAINAVTGDGIIQHAVNAKTDYKKAQDEENKILSYYEQYLDAQGDLGPWKQDGNKIYMENSEGEPIELEIGDVVNYNAIEGVTDNSLLSYTSKEAVTGVVGDQTFTATSDIKWKVLGIQNGKILLISANDITIDDDYYSMAYNKLYLYGINELNNICLIYGHGKGAQSARCVMVDDINKITGYNTVVKGTDFSGINTYGNKIVFTSENNQITYTSPNGNGVVKNNHGEIITDSTLYYIEDGTWKTTLPIGESRSFKVDAYMYASSLNSTSVSSRNINMKMDSNSKEYKMLFNNLSDLTEAKYFLSSATVSFDEEQMYTVKYGLRTVSSGGVGLVRGAYNGSGVAQYAIRPVITLKSDVKLEDTNNDGILEVN